MEFKSQRINSVIGEGSSFEGRFRVSGSLEINGQFEGDIETEDKVVIQEDGKVRTNIKTHDAEIHGTLIGNINATGGVHLFPTGKVMGDIHSPVVNIEQGAITKGSVNITGGEKRSDLSSLINESFTEKNSENDPDNGSGS